MAQRDEIERDQYDKINGLTASVRDGNYVNRESVNIGRIVA